MSYPEASPSTPQLFSTLKKDNYFDLDDIIVCQEKVTCTFQSTVHRLGYIDPGSNKEDIQENAKMELPYWLAKALCTRKRKIVSIEYPNVYRSSYLQILAADANVVDLHKWGPSYYRLGEKLFNFEHDESRPLAEGLLQAFISRFRRVMDSSQNAQYQDTYQLTEKLDEIERKIFKSTRQNVEDFERWQVGKSNQLSTSEAILSHRKRKHTDDNVS
ncbi:DNA replication complex GINS protein PSF3 [Trichoplax sp. H2]|nr:DNA replication complex GINS protein PSF3 [Trichoplax sp. H2]|eukprot:RDD43073.1 DNA replication complex GINS protein PSF3 [Trichoplax sp. H2]